MKKFLILILLGGIMTSIQAKTLVAYFSATGTTKQLAKTAASALKADLFEIEPAQKYSAADLDWHDKKSRSTIESNDPKSRPAIAKKTDLAQYDTVVVAFPIWWYNAPKIIYTFMESYDFAGKKIALICTSGGSGLGRTTGDIRKVISPKADLRGGDRFDSDASEAELQKFFGKLFK